MAEASDCSRAASSWAAAAGPADSVVVVMASALEDVVEEEEVFLSQTSTLKSGVEVGAVQRESAQSSTVKQLQSEFLPLIIRKQVSYSQYTERPGTRHLKFAAAEAVTTHPITSGARPRLSVEYPSCVHKAGPCNTAL
ncbi:hypothetical protein Baya_15508 [Bagarius yarrelli]|uniref:Uncharacterized protein n=1 Tax=Bagarius yarrelli TaxID=175774 RepID=A0A556VBY0_BAGYA|nr:hypothetical protein Baya_15508 [Bagarius yarrelli]